MIILTIISILILDLVLPPASPQGLSPIGPELVVFLDVAPVLHILSTTLASIISGFLVRFWGQDTFRAWQGSLVGLVIGGSVPLCIGTRAFAFLVLDQAGFFLTNEVITTLIYCAFMAMVGLLGYYGADYKYRRQVTQ